jgi:hypothetical protein
MIVCFYITQLDHLTPSNREDGHWLFVTRRPSLTPGQVRQFNFLFQEGFLSLVLTNLGKLPVERVDLVNKNYISGTYRNILCVLFYCLVLVRMTIVPTARFFWRRNLALLGSNTDSTDMLCIRNVVFTGATKHPGW